MPQFCTVAREGRLTVVTLNRPEVMNAVHPPASTELAEVWDAFEADPEQMGGYPDRRRRQGVLKWTPFVGPR